MYHWLRTSSAYGTKFFFLFFLNSIISLTKRVFTDFVYQFSEARCLFAFERLLWFVAKQSSDVMMWFASVHRISFLSAHSITHTSMRNASTVSEFPKHIFKNSLTAVVSLPVATHNAAQRTPWMDGWETGTFICTKFLVYHIPNKQTNNKTTLIYLC